jgi:hypothetical protein
MKTKVDFVPHGADFEMRLWKSTLDCRVKQTLDATTVVDFAPHGVDLRCKKRKALPEGKIERLCVARSGL